MKITETERAALSALLARVESGEAISAAMAQTIVPSLLAPLFAALTKKRLDDLVARAIELHKRGELISRPKGLDTFIEGLQVDQKQFKSMKARLPRLLRERADLDRRIKAHEDFLSSVKERWRDRYAMHNGKFSDWVKSERRDGWPPEFYEKPPLHLAFPDDELPVEYALRRLLREVEV